jgi:hypothetical protein
MPKIVAYTALHYGKTYLDAAIRSIIYDVDEYHVLYCPHPSHGYNNGMLPPDTEEELHAIAWEAAGTKLRWHKGDWQRENDQRNSIFQYAPTADAIVIVDSDEVYEDFLVGEALALGFRVGCNQLRLPFIHLWRSFNRGFSRDPAYPTRVLFPKQSGRTETLATGRSIWHYGYAQPSEIVRYKVQNHGHLSEFRRDVDWFKDVFMANRQVDCHPIGSEWWNVEEVDQSRLPSALMNHPLRHVELIP